jgi:rubrerythrin
MTKVQSEIEAIKIAMDAEMEAHKNYTQFVQKSTNPKGKDMFRQLAVFELNHYNNLKALLGSLSDAKGWTTYSGTQFSETPAFIEGEASSVEVSETKDEVLSILSKAIDGEKKACEYYTKLAEETTDPAGKAMFTKLADEEKLHTKILNDQWYSLNNQGIWIWGD